MKILNNDVKNTKHFCILPWIHFHAWPDKRVLPCCVANSQMPVSSTDKDSVLDIMNSERYKEIRVKMLNDEYVEECSRCYDLENYGVWSLRQSNNTRRFDSSKDLVQLTKTDGTINKFKLKYLDIRFSNLCNMKCRTCGPACSSRWAEEHQQNFGKETLESHFNMKKIVVSNNEENDLLEKLKPYLLDVEEVYFAGGEALITNEHYDILDYWIENKHTDVELTYTTNFLTLRYKDKNAIDYWKKFSNIQIWASLDGSDNVIEYLRHGAKWDVILENIAELKREVPHAKFGITPTISIYNVFQFPKFLKWLLYNDIIPIDGLRLNILTNPWYMGLDILPLDIALQAKKIWKDIFAAIKNGGRFRPEEVEQNLQQMFSVFTALQNAKGNIGGLKEFFDRSELYDGIRKEDLFENIPELKDVYTWLKENS